MTRSRLCKSQYDRIMVGVCGGLAEHFEIDPVLVRLAFVLIGFAGGIGVVAYALLAVMMPVPDAGAAPVDPPLGSPIRDPYARGQIGREPIPYRASEVATASLRNTVALLMVVAGVAVFLANVGAFRWFNWGTFWPTVFIGIGLALVAVRFRKS